MGEDTARCASERERETCTRVYTETSGAQVAAATARQRGATGLWATSMLMTCLRGTCKERAKLMRRGTDAGGDMTVRPPPQSLFS